MNLNLIWYFLIGALLGNGMPHFIWGRSNTIARSPFGQKSKPSVNVRWGLFNFLAATVISIWQIYKNTFTGNALIALLIGFWLMVAMFGFRIKQFLK